MPDEQARPDARSHVSADQVSDLLEGLLPADEAATVAAHLSACPQCAEVRDRLAAMPALLASVRTDDPVVPMPADVAARLDRALAAEARDRAAAPAEQPAEEQQVADVVPISRAGRTRKVFAGLVAAAAVVVGFVVVGDVVGGSDGNDSADVTAADSDAGSAEAGGDARTKMGEGAPSPETSVTGAGPGVPAGLRRRRHRAARRLESVDGRPGLCRGRRRRRTDRVHAGPARGGRHQRLRRPGRAARGRAGDAGHQRPARPAAGGRLQLRQRLADRAGPGGRRPHRVTRAAAAGGIRDPYDALKPGGTRTGSRRPA